MSPPIPTPDMSVSSLPEMHPRVEEIEAPEIPAKDEKAQAAVSLFEKGARPSMEAIEKNSRPLGEAFRRVSYSMHGFLIATTAGSLLMYNSELAAMGMAVSRTGSIGLAFAVGVGIGIGLDHLVGASRDDGRTLSASFAAVCDGDKSKPADEPRPNERGEFTKGWRFVRDDVPDEVRGRSIRINILGQKLLTRLKELDFGGDGRYEVFIDENGIRYRSSDLEHRPVDFKDLNDKQRDFLSGEGHDIALELYTLRVEQEEDRMRRAHASTH